MARPDNYTGIISVAARLGRQRGYLMVVSMLIILLITIMSISMAKSFFLEEGMAGNLREKSRSFAAAQAGLRYGEYQAVQNGQSSGSATCAAGLLSYTTTPPVCNPLVAISTSSTSVAPISSYYQMPQPNLAIATIATTGGDAFYKVPGIYVQYQGPLIGGAVYLITAFGYGGTASSVSVVQSTLQVTCQNRTVQSGKPAC